MPGSRGTLSERFWAKVELPADGNTNACYLWRGALSKKRNGRRGTIRLGGRGTLNALVCRVMCEWTHGPAPTSDHEAGHTCPTGENNICVNPRHLRWMTRTENEHWKRTYETAATTMPGERDPRVGGHAAV